MAVHFWRIRKDGSISGPAPILVVMQFEAGADFPNKRALWTKAGGAVCEEKCPVRQSE